MEREAFEHYLRDATRCGPVPDGAFTGAAGGAACGDLSRISLVLDGGRVVDATFDAEGCGATRAATAAAVEMACDAPVLDAAAIGIDDVDAALGGLTPAKRHAAQLAADALHRALAAAASSAEPLAAAVPRTASWSRCRAASTAPSRRCWRGSAGQRSSG